MFPQVWDRGYIGSQELLSKEIVELHSGEITVESYPDKGTCFRVMLPLVEA